LFKLTDPKLLYDSVNGILFHFQYSISENFPKKKKGLQKCDSTEIKQNPN